jgi:dienelactone hydrolase
MPKASSIVVRIALLILLSAFAACKSAARPASAPLPPPLPSGAPADGPRTEATNAVLAGGWIDVSLSVPRVGTGPFPVVISPIVADDTLLERGFAVARFHTNWESLRGLPGPAASPPAASGPAAPPDDGATTVGKWLLTAPRPGIVGRAYFDIITTDAEKSLPQVVDWLVTRPEVDPARIALTGSSTSGFVALQAMAVEPRIAVGVVRVACGDYLTFLRSSSLALNDDPRWLPDGKLALDPDYAVEIAAREPIRNADRYPPRPLLLLAGERDQAIPIACVDNTVTRFRAAYHADGADDRFRFVSYAEGGHNLSGDANAEILPWLERWMAPYLTASAR